MANIYGCGIKITGDNEQLEALSKRLTEQDPKLLETVYNFTIDNKSDFCINNASDITFEYDEITFYFGGRNSAPLDDITTLSIEYPALEFIVNYEEGGNEDFGEAFIQDGSCNINEMEEQEYVEKYSQVFIDELSAMNALSYEEFISEYAHDNFFNEHPYGYLDRHIVKRIKHRDLAKFINREWFDDVAEEEFKSRLTEGSNEGED